MRTSDFDYYLPEELIAQTPVEPRDRSRLMVVTRSTGALAHHRFFELAELLREGDVLVFNDSRTIPARLIGRKPGSGGKVEVLLLRRVEPGVWETLVKPGRRARTGATIEVCREPGTGNGVTAEVVGEREEGIRVVRFSDESLLPALGAMPLPPYIHTPLADPGRYQTIYARIDGSVATPTAGLHFTPELLKRLVGKGVECQFVTLHVGLDTFRPVQESDPLQHRIHQEYGVVSDGVAVALSRARREGRRIIAVGTTSVRLLEAVAQVSSPQEFAPFSGRVSLFIVPGHRFQAVDAMITNFHLPRSTLLMLVSAFAGMELVQRVYREAIDCRYRFYSFGDAMLVL